MRINKHFVFVFCLAISYSASALDLSWSHNGSKMPTDLINQLLKHQDLTVLDNYFGVVDCSVEDFQYDTELSIQQKLALIDKAQNRESFCEAAQAYYSLTTEFLPHNIYGYVGSIINLILARDYVSATDTANEFLSRHNHSQNEQSVRVLLLIAAYHRSLDEGIQFNQVKTADFLGLHADQVPKKELSYNLSVRSYLELFPKGQYIELVNKMQKNARIQYCRHQLNVASYRIQRNDYVAAIEVLDPVLKNYGYLTEILPEALYLEVAAQSGLSKAVLHTDSIEDTKIWMWTGQEPGSPIDRKKISLSAWESATDFAKSLKAKFPASSWNKKAQDLLK